MSYFTGIQAPCLCSHLLNRVLDTEMYYIFLVPELAQHLETDPQMLQTVIFTRQTVKASGDIIDCLPNDELDRTYLSQLFRVQGR